MNPGLANEVLKIKVIQKSVHEKQNQNGIGLKKGLKICYVKMWLTPGREMMMILVHLLSRIIHLAQSLNAFHIWSSCSDTILTDVVFSFSNFNSDSNSKRFRFSVLISSVMLSQS